MSRLVDQNEDEKDANFRQAALSELYRRYAPVLLVYLRHHSASIEDAEDLLLEVFAAAPELQSPVLATKTLVYSITMELKDKQNITTVQAFDASNGALRWTSEPIMNVATSGVTPILVNRAIYFCANFGGEATMIGKVFTLNPQTGQQLRVVASLPVELYRLLPVNDRIYLSYATHNPDAIDQYGNTGLLALDMATYHQIWFHATDDFPSTPSIDNGVLYAMMQNRMEAVNTTNGKLIWQQDLSKQLYPK